MVAFAIGFLTSRYVSNSKTKGGDGDSSIQQCADLNDAKANLISISKNEYLEYTQIKDLKQKYEKADELLGKIMLLFLADVGFRLQKSGVVEPIVASNPAVVPEPPIAQPTKPSVDTIPTAAVTSNAPAESALAGKGSAIRNLQNEKQIDDVLNKALIENPKIENAKGNSPTLAQRRLLEGKYIGAIKFLDSKRAGANIVWDLTPDYAKPEFAGTFNLSIQGSGINSEGNSRGTLDSIVSLAEDKDGFLVTSCGGNCYLQLYYNRPADQFYGNFYESKDSKNFSRSGNVELRK